MRNETLLLPVFSAAGILAYFDCATEHSLAWSAAFAFACAITTVLLWRQPAARILGLSASFAAFGFALACLATARAENWVALPRHAVELSGRIGTVEDLPAGRRITVTAPSLDGAPPVRRALRVRLRNNDPAALSPGDWLKIRCLLQPPAAPDYPGGWDTQRDAFFSGLGGYGFAIGPAQVTRKASATAWNGLRERLATRIMAALPGAPGAIAATLLTGSGTAIPAADRAAFEASGLAHLLAVAGLHIGIVMGLVFAAVRLGLAAWEYAALAWPTRKIAVLASLGAGFFYLELTGAHIPILRSFGMAALVTLAVLTDRRALSLRGLAVAAMVLMVAAPETIMGVSFQMSFAAVMCLIVGYELARPILLRLGEGGIWRRPLLYAAGLVLSSLLAGTASLPFAAYHFGRVTPYYVPANMLAVPLTAFWVMPWGMAALALMPAGLERFALTPMEWGIRGLLFIAHGVAAWPAASLPVAQWPPWSLALISAGLVLGGILRGRARLVGAVPLCLGLMAPLFAPQPDMLVGPDARLIAIRRGQEIFAETAQGLSAYEAQAPARLWGIDTPTAPLPCAAATDCRVTLGGNTVFFARAGNTPDCGAAVIVSAGWLHGPCTGKLVIDHGFVQREGATTIRLAASGPVIVTDRAIRGARRWVVRATPSLPMAKTE